MESRLVECWPGEEAVMNQGDFSKPPWFFLVPCVNAEKAPLATVSSPNLN
jgi:hypothetical protein